MQWLGKQGSKGEKAGDQTPPVAVAEGDKPQRPSPSRSSGRRRAWFFVAHAMILVLGVIGLAILNQNWGLDRLLDSRWQMLHAVWLPLLFLLVYLLCWLCWWAIRQWGPDQLSGEFPELDKAWADARRALADAGIDLRKSPLFLVLGQPEGGIELLFAASHWPFQVRFAAQGREPLLHVYGSREAVFVACGCGSSLAALTRGQATAERAEPEPTASVPVLPGEDPAAEVALLPAALPSEASPAKAEQSAPAARISLLGEDSWDDSEPPVAAWPAADPAATGQYTARLRALCRSIAHDRQPFVPVNGVLALFPLSATDSPQRARAVAAACRLDLRTVRESLGTECPRLAMLCDLQRVPGFDELVAAFPDRPAKQWVLGRTFPLVPDIEAARWPGMIEQGLRWLTDSLWPSAIYPIMQAGPADWKLGEPTLQANQRCFHLLEEGWRRMRLVPEILVRSFQASPSAPPLFGGFALAATGADSLRQQGFVAGALRWLVEAQDHVGWTEDALREDALCRRWARVGWLALTAFVILSAALTVRLLW